jgi:hypothetical protein
LYSVKLDPPGTRIPLSCTREREAQREQARRRLLLRGPVSMVWLAAAARLSGKALHVGILVWFRVGCEGTRSIRLQPEVRKLFGLNRHAVHRALRDLERERLVLVERHRGRAPAVEVLDVSCG